MFRFYNVKLEKQMSEKKNMDMYFLGIFQKQMCKTKMKKKTKKKVHN